MDEAWWAHSAAAPQKFPEASRYEIILPDVSRAASAVPHHDARVRRQVEFIPFCVWHAFPAALQ
jgi:hypothetical protein